MPAFPLFFFFFFLSPPSRSSFVPSLCVCLSYYWKAQMFPSNEKHSAPTLKFGFIFNSVPKGHSNENLRHNRTPKDRRWKQKLFEFSSNIHETVLNTIMLRYSLLSKMSLNETCSLIVLLLGFCHSEAQRLTRLSRLPPFGTWKHAKIPFTDMFSYCFLQATHTLSTTSVLRSILASIY